MNNRCEATIGTWSPKTSYMSYGDDPFSGTRRCKRKATHYCRGLYVCETHAKKYDFKKHWRGASRVKLTPEFARSHLLP